MSLLAQLSRHSIVIGRKLVNHSLNSLNNSSHLENIYSSVEKNRNIGVLLRYLFPRSNGDIHRRTQVRR